MSLEPTTEYFGEILRKLEKADPLADLHLKARVAELSGKEFVPKPSLHKMHAGSGSAVVCEAETAPKTQSLNEDIWAIDMDRRG